MKTVIRENVYFGDMHCNQKKEFGKRFGKYYGDSRDREELLSQVIASAYGIQNRSSVVVLQVLYRYQMVRILIWLFS